MQNVKDLLLARTEIFLYTISNGVCISPKLEDEKYAKGVLKWHY